MLMRSRHGAELRVAVVHEWLVNCAGSEKVVEQILKVYPQAELFSLVDFLADGERGFLGGRRATTSFLQRMPFARKHYRSYLPLMPLAVEQFDLSGFDLVISSNHAVAKGVITGPDQVHVSYVHTPVRYAWDLQHQYLRESGMASGLKSWIARATLHYLRIWDTRTASGVDSFLANSAYVGRRIRKAYRREATVLFPPVDVHRFALRHEKEDFYLTASRMVPYKRMAMIVEAFAAMPERKLVVIGEGPEFERVKLAARGAPHISLLGFQSNAVLVDHMARARAFVFAAEEDFGIIPVEAQACGTPVIAFGAGGALETVVDSPDPALRTGVFFHAQTAQAVRDAVADFESRGAFLPQACRANAMRFSPEVFAQGLREAVDAALLHHFSLAPLGRSTPQAVSAAGRS